MLLLITTFLVLLFKRSLRWSEGNSERGKGVVDWIEGEFVVRDGRKIVAFLFLFLSASRGGSGEK